MNNVLSTSTPSVSCVMPTHNRGSFIQAAIDCWLKQTYENRELIILDDGDMGQCYPVPHHPRIRYEFLEKPEALGRKRNLINGMARGDVICHWDDDDWSAPDRIADQVHRLQETGKPITGYGTLLFWDTISKQAKRYRSTVAGYVVGTSLCYLRSYWEKHQFPPKQEASDNGFVYPVLRQIAAFSDACHMVARIHNCHHTSRKSGITQVVSKELIPNEFWENEKLRLR